MNPEIILGPPGTGKTTTLLNMLDEELAKGTDPEAIGFVSFTKRAAEEAKERAKTRFNLKDKQLMWFRTLHSLCFYALGITNAEVMEGKKMVEFGDWIGVPVSGKVSFEDGTAFGFDTGDRCLFMDNISRVRGVPLRHVYEEDSDGLPWNVVEKVSRGLAEFKAARGLHDFTDMLTEFVESDWSARLEVLFVDESQDLSNIQWKVVRKLAEGARRVVVAGDDDQAIYRWAGADVDQFVSLDGTVRVLNKSHRVPPLIHSISQEMISRIHTRREKLWTPKDGDPGIVDRVGSLDDIDYDSGEDLLILSRNTCFLKDDAIPLMKSLGILYGFRGGTVVKQSVINSILDWEKLRQGDVMSVEKVEHIYNLMRSGEGYTRGHKKLPFWSDRDALVNMNDLQTHGGLLVESIWHEAMTRMAVEDRLYMVKALKRGEKFNRKPNVRLSTIHGSKGGEAAHVVLLTDMAWRTYQESQMFPEDEARTWYVAATRAKSRLTIVRPQTRRSYQI